MTAVEIPATSIAQVPVLHEGYGGLDGDAERVNGTVTFITDGSAVIIPGHGAPFRPAAFA